MKRNGAMGSVASALTMAAAMICLALGSNPAPAATNDLSLSLCAPGENTFDLAIDNSFLPLPVGRQWIFQGKEQGETIGLQITVLDEVEMLYRGQARVATRVVEETEWFDANANASSIRTKT